MTGSTRNESHPGIACGICARLIPLETTKTDETGNSVHEECYVRHTILRLRTPTYPSPSRKAQNLLNVFKTLPSLSLSAVHLKTVRQ
jgi:hypothetical protein